VDTGREQRPGEHLSGCGAQLVGGDWHRRSLVKRRFESYQEWFVREDDATILLERDSEGGISLTVNDPHDEDAGHGEVFLPLPTLHALIAAMTRIAAEAGEPHVA
jgi:hypothetical protein